jgi:integrase/recombinase XerD
MPRLKVTLYIRITTPEGKRKMCAPVYAARGRLKPLCAADARGNSLGYHPEGEYYLRYAGKWQAVGNDPCVALDRFEQRKFELRQSATTDGAGSTGQLSRLMKPQLAGAEALDAAIAEYLTTGKAAEKNWRKHTVQCYTLGLKLFRKSCDKTYLDEIDGDDLRRFKVFLRKQETQTKTVKKRIDDRTVWNHFNNVVGFLNSYGRQNLIPQREWPTYEEKPPEAYDAEDVKLLFQYADEDERDVIEFFCGVGFRNGEGTHTEWHDVDLRNKEITIYSKPEQFDWRMKDSEKRTIGISDRLVERLKARHKRHPGDGLVFPNSRGNPDKHLLRIIKRVALRAGLNCGRCFGTHNRKRVSCRTRPVCHKWLVQTFRKTWARMAFSAILSIASRIT